MDSNTEFFYEIEKWNNGRNSYVWVNIPEEISPDSDYTFFMYYNNNMAFSSQSNNVWDSNYKAVYHLTDWGDSTSNSYDLSERTSGYPSSATGIVGGCADFDGGDPHDLYHSSNDAGLTITGDLTLSGWVNLDAVNQGKRILPCFGAYGESPSVNYLYDIYPTDTGKIKWLHEYGSGTNQYDVTVSDYLSADNWIYLTVVRDSMAKEYKFFINGVFKESTSYSVNPDSGSSSYLSVGGQPIGDDVLDGGLDEQRISNTMRSAGWIKASYHTMAQTSGFLTFGDEQTVPQLEKESWRESFQDWLWFIVIIFTGIVIVCLRVRSKSSKKITQIKKKIQEWKKDGYDVTELEEKFDED